MTSSPKINFPEANVEPQAVEPSVEPGKGYVRYIGRATRRIIDSDAWAGEGAANHPTTEWNFQNGFRLPVSDFSKEALAYFAKDNGFKIETA